MSSTACCSLTFPSRWWEMFCFFLLKRPSGPILRSIEWVSEWVSEWVCYKEWSFQSRLVLARRDDADITIWTATARLRADRTATARVSGASWWLEGTLNDAPIDGVRQLVDGIGQQLIFFCQLIILLPHSLHFTISVTELLFETPMAIIESKRKERKWERGQVSWVDR